MNPYGILMLIFGGMIILFGFSYYRGNKDLLPIRYHGPKTKSYLKYLGKVTMTVSLAPILSGLISFIPGIGESIIPVIVLIVGFIIIIIISIKIYKLEDK